MEIVTHTIAGSFMEILSATFVLLAFSAFITADVSKAKKSVFWKGFSIALCLLSISSIATVLEHIFLPNLLNNVEHICNVLAGVLFAWNIYVRYTQLGSHPRIYEL